MSKNKKRKDFKQKVPTLKKELISNEWDKYLVLDKEYVKIFLSKCIASKEKIVPMQEKPQKVYDIYSKGIFAAGKYNKLQQYKDEIIKNMSRPRPVNELKILARYLLTEEEPNYSVPSTFSEMYEQEFIHHDRFCEGNTTATEIKPLSFSKIKIRLEDLLYKTQQEPEQEITEPELTALGLEGCGEMFGSSKLVTLPIDFKLSLREISKFSHLAHYFYVWNLNWLGAAIDLQLRTNRLIKDLKIKETRGWRHLVTPYVKLDEPIMCPVPISIGEQDIITDVHRLCQYALTRDPRTPDEDIAETYGLWILIGKPQGITIEEFENDFDLFVDPKILTEFPGQWSYAKYRWLFSKDILENYLKKGLKPENLDYGMKHIVLKAFSEGFITEHWLIENIDPKIILDLGLYTPEELKEKLTEVEPEDEAELPSFEELVNWQDYEPETNEGDRDLDQETIPLEDFFQWERDEGFNAERSRPTTSIHWPFDNG